MKNRKRKKIKLHIIIPCFIIFILFTLLVTLLFMRLAGQNSLRSKGHYDAAKMGQQFAEEPITEAEKRVWQAGWIKHNGRIYSYKEDILTFLFMGIDKDDKVSAVDEGTDAGQADALFLLVIDKTDKAIKVIAINRNTMADVDLYDENGTFLTTTKAQIAVQHGFGDGLEKSCGYQVEAVRKLFYHIPIHGYCAMNMDAIIDLTDLIGGISLTAIEDVKSAIQDETLGAYVVDEGETVLLDGRKAYSYVRYREAESTGAADKRLLRQKQFLMEFMNKTKAALKKDVSLAVKLYQAVEDKMVTDIGVDEILFLATSSLGYSFHEDQLYTLAGETVKGEEFDEFYADEEALYQLIVDVFYEQVEEAVFEEGKE